VSLAGKIISARNCYEERLAKVVLKVQPEEAQKNGTTIIVETLLGHLQGMNAMTPTNLTPQQWPVRINAESILTDLGVALRTIRAELNKQNVLYDDKMLTEHIERTMRRIKDDEGILDAIAKRLISK
ncbi:MAG TPA: hypothetical protein VGH65_09040, partial [Verrucomicrobiaceae bacterium]